MRTGDKYIKGTDNYPADALSRLPLINYEVTESNVIRVRLAEIYVVDQLYGDTFPRIYLTIKKYQSKEKI